MSNRAKAIHLRIQGLSYSAIAQQLGISRQRVQQITAPPTIIRDIVVGRAEGKCQVCEVYTGKGGHVHHLQANGQSVEEYSDLTNLRLLCTSCHLKAHAGSGSPTPKAVRADRAEQPTYILLPPTSPLTAHTCNVCQRQWFPLKTGAAGPRRCPNPACRSTKWRGYDTAHYREKEGRKAK